MIQKDLILSVSHLDSRISICGQYFTTILLYTADISQIVIWDGSNTTFITPSPMIKSPHPLDNVSLRKLQMSVPPPVYTSLLSLSGYCNNSYFLVITSWMKEAGAFYDSLEKDVSTFTAVSTKSSRNLLTERTTPLSSLTGIVCCSFWFYDLFVL